MSTPFIAAAFGLVLMFNFTWAKDMLPGWRVVWFALTAMTGGILLMSIFIDLLVLGLL